MHRKEEDLMKKYFLKDETISNIDEDQFRYQDFANNIKKIIEYNKAPFNIAIVGKWGLGKSSLINMALEPLKKRDNDYLICNINAWKYEKDEIGKAFLKELYENVSNEKILSFNFFHNEYSKLVKNSLNKEEPAKKEKSWREFSIYIVLCLLFSIVAFFFYCKVSNDFYGINFSCSNFIKSSGLRYCKNIGSILIVPLVVWLGKLFMDKLNIPANKNYEITFPLETQADYELYLRTVLGDFRKKNKDKKIIVVLDDLDRLSALKIVEALDALKIFMEYDEFIFIVPFDDEILKNALVKNKLDSINNFENKYNGDMVLDKLFQYKLYLPQLIKSDMRNYAFDICKDECSDFKKEYFAGNLGLFEDIVGKILIHNNVSTPRQVKKIINTFIENVMIARDREAANRVYTGFASEKQGLETIAKISVLQADYNAFYDILFQNANAVYEILEVHRKETDEIKSSVLTKFFEIKENTYVLKPEYEPLVNFLSFTENLGKTNISPYLYMAQSKAGVVVGDQKQQDFMSAVESCNLITAKQMLNDMPILLDVLMEHLLYGETPMIGNIVVSSIECWEAINNDKRCDFSNALVERMKSIISGKLDFRFDLLNIKNVVEICKTADSSKYNDLIEYTFALCDKNQELEKLLKKITMVKDDLSEHVSEIYNVKVRKWISADETTLKSIIEFVEHEQIDYVANMYGKDYIEKVIGYITENDDFDDGILKQLGRIMKRYLENNSITKIEKSIKSCFEYPILHNLLDKSINDKNYTEINDSEDIAKKIILIGYDKLNDNSISILKKLSYKIVDTDSEVYDTFFLQAITHADFAGLILAFERNNSLSLISNTIKKFINVAFSDEGYDEDAKLLVCKLSQKQAEQFWSVMKSECGYSSGKDYSIVARIILELEKESVYRDNIGMLINTTIRSNLESYYNVNNYIEFSSLVLNGFKDNMSDEEINEFSLLILKLISTDTYSALNRYRNIHMRVPEKSWCKNILNILNYVSKETYTIIYDIATARKTLFNDENKNLEQFASFLVDYIDLSNDPDGVISVISTKFKVIPNTVTLVEKIVEIEINEDDTAVKIAKYVDALEISDIIKIISDKRDKKEKLMMLLSMTQKYSLDNILKQVNLAKEELSKSDLMIAIEYCEAVINVENVGCFAEISNYLCRNYPEKDIFDKVLNIISILTIDAIEKQKELIAELIAFIFVECSSDISKKKASMIIKEKKLSRIIKKSLKEEQITEYKSFIS